MKESAANWHLISTLDDIAWTFNLRGSDIEFNPVFIAYALIVLKRPYCLSIVISFLMKSGSLLYPTVLK